MKKYLKFTNNFCFVFVFFSILSQYNLLTYYNFSNEKKIPRSPNGKRMKDRKRI